MVYSVAGLELLETPSGKEESWAWPQAINDEGVVVGAAFLGGVWATRWQDGQIENIHPAPCSPFSSWATDINNKKGTNQQGKDLGGTTTDKPF